jgi:DNA-binding GntR family transcriptional regulator
MVDLLNNVYKNVQLEMGTLSKQVMQFIQNSIMSGELKPGEIIVESTVAKALGVSRAPVREAMRILEAKGLVTIVPRKGIFVAKLSITELDEIYGVRINLECMAMKQAYAINRDQLLLEMKQSLENQKKSIQKKAVTKYLQENIHFHDIFINLSGNSYLVSLLQNIEEVTLRYRVSSLSLAGRMEKSYDDHLSLYQHLEAGDLDKAQEALERHITSSAEKMKELIALG